MEKKRYLMAIEKRIAPLYKIRHVKTVWLVDMSGEKGVFAEVSIILDDTKKGYNRARKKSEKFLKSIKNTKSVQFVFNIHSLSEYWKRLVSNDPKLYSEMRISIILYDPAGFFAPLKVLLLEGKIPCTREATYGMIFSAPEKIMRVKREIKSNILTKIYNLVVDAGQAPMVMKGFDPPIPKMLPDALKSTFSRSELPKKDINILRGIISYYKDVEHGNINAISSNNLHVFLEASEEFIKRMEKLMNKFVKYG